MKRLQLLDYVRHFAALMVVFFHYTFNGISNGKIYSIDFIPSLAGITKYGYLGVDLFFMISGYVIFYSAKNRSAAKFAVSRVIRLYPAYWLAVIFTSAFTCFFGGSVLSIDLKTVLVNLTMLQSLFGVENVDGVYWTLIFELKFYLFIFILLFFGLQKHLSNIIVAWGVIIIISYFLSLEDRLFMGGYYGFFVSGSLFAILRERFTFLRFSILSGLYVITTIYMVNRADLLEQATGTNNSPFIIAVVIAVFYLFFFLQNTKYTESMKLKGSKLAGALTYPIYLIHAHFGYMMLNKLANNQNKIYVYIAIIFSVYVIALLIHLFVERKLAFLWGALFSIIIEKPVTKVQIYFDKIKFLFFTSHEKA
ncbi:acyltransferase family protein [Serratia fonticola]|uniref:acyltransferase family protein n=1 Tax=Serratia fonticola TaxID=47917 RepID=UPI00192B4908|nr:acyltransferase [Serratia fonticola]MBL5824655.1 acyltransferase [Serratia fonticola]